MFEYGETFEDGRKFGNWCRMIGVSNPPSPESLKQTEAVRIEKADAYRQANPWVSNPEYYDVCKKWPLKEI